MKIRLPIPYATKTKGKKELRIGVGTIELREVSSEDAPVVALQTDTYQHSDDGKHSQVTDFRFMEGVFYAPFQKSTQDNRKYPFSTLSDLPDADRLDAHEFLVGWQNALDAVPFFPPSYKYPRIMGKVSEWYDRLTPDDMDNAPALLKSKSWAYVNERVAEAILIDGAIYTKSIGPAYNLWTHADGTKRVFNRSATSRSLPFSSTWMAWDRETLLEEYAGSVTAGDLDSISFAEGIDPKSFDTGYDPIALAIEGMAWDLLNEGHSISNTSDAHLKAILNLRNAIAERMPEAEALFGPRYPENPRAWDKIFTEPGKAYELLPLIDAYRDAHWVNGYRSGQIEELKRRVKIAMSDDAALTNAFT